MANNYRGLAADKGVDYIILAPIKLINADSAAKMDEERCKGANAIL